ncbi:MAG TPA: hypothetical protein VGC86_18380 [Afipia sp.]
MTNDPANPEYNAKARDIIMDLSPFYDPNHRCGIVREHVFKDYLIELRERHRLALESKYCLWDYHSQTGLYLTECDHEYFFDLGRKRDVPFKFCPFCAGNITAM